MIKIRLARKGRTHRPIYTIVASDSRNARDGRFITRLGQYDPNRDEPFSDVRGQEIQDWIKKGAQLSDSLKSLFKKYKVQLQ